MISSKPKSIDLGDIGGEMGKLIRSKDWSTSPLGSMDDWPQSLLTAISIMLESSFAMVVAWGPDFLFFYNDRYRPVLGHTKHPGAMGAPANEIFPEAWNFIGPLFNKTRAGESVALDDVLIPLDRNGYLENCYFTLSYSPIRDEKGVVVGMLAVVAETTERVQSERRLKTLRDLLRAAGNAYNMEAACERATTILADNAVDIPFSLLYLMSADGKKMQLVSSSGLPENTKANPSLIDLNSVDSESSWPVSEVLESRTFKLVTDLFHRFGNLQGGPYPEQTHSAIILPLALPEQTVPYGVFIAGVSPRRKFDEAYHIFFDLAADHIRSALRNADVFEQERQRAAALAEIDRAKTVFFSNISHEFRTPLTLMLGPLQEVMNNVQQNLSASQQENLDIARRNALRLLKLVNTLLDFSRIEVSRIQANYEPQNLSALTIDLASNFRSAIEKAGMELVIDLPELHEPVYVDKEMWEKIVLNLLSNAIKFTWQGSITISLRKKNNHAVLTVMDTGVGIPEENITHIFERFYRVQHSRGRTHEGTGIGLSLVQEMVKLHAGEINVVSQQGVGTTFTVSIPLGNSHLPPSQVDIEKTRASTSTEAEAYTEEAMNWLLNHKKNNSRSINSSAKVRSDGGASDQLKPKILLADDNADMREYARNLLSNQYDLTVVSEGQAALRSIEIETPDLVISDIMMPVMDGFELLKKIRENPRISSLPVILLSARAGEEAVIEGLKKGADDYLVKPFTAAKLRAIIQNCLRINKERVNEQEKMRTEAFVKVEMERSLKDRTEDLQRKNEELQKQKDFIEVILDSVVDIVAVFDCDMNYVSVNKKCHEIYGLSKEEMIGRNLLELFPEVKESDMYNNLQRALTGETIYTQAYRSVVTGRYFENYYVPLTDQNKQVYGALVIAHDNTSVIESNERINQVNQSLLKKNREIALSEERYHKMINEVEDYAIILLDKDGFIQNWNKGAEKIKGYTEAEIIGKNFRAFYRQQDQEIKLPEKLIALAIQNGRAIHEGWRVRKDRSLFWGSIVLTALHDEADNIIGFSKVTRDLTERKAAEEKLINYAKRLEHSNQELEQFAFVASHDLQEPLRKIKTFADRLQETNQEKLDKKTIFYLDKILLSAHRMSELIEDLLQYSRTARIKDQHVKTDLNKIFKNVLNDLELMIQQKQAIIKTDELPELESVPLQMGQLFNNLINNSLKFSVAGNTPIISIRCQALTINEITKLDLDPTQSYYELVFSDNGIGFSQEFAEKIFEIFQRLNPRHEFSGSGIGLSICRKIVTNHHGKIFAQSNEGHGASFHVILPLEQPRTAAEER